MNKQLKIAFHSNIEELKENPNQYGNSKEESLNANERILGGNASKLAETLNRRNSLKNDTTGVVLTSNMRNRVMKTLNKLKGRMKIQFQDENTKFFHRRMKYFENNPTFLHVSDIMKSINPNNENSHKYEENKDFKLISNYYESSIYKLRANKNNDFSGKEVPKSELTQEQSNRDIDLNNKYIHAYNTYYRLPEIRKKNMQKLQKINQTKTLPNDYSVEGSDEFRNFMLTEKSHLQQACINEYEKKSDNYLDLDMMESLLQKEKEITETARDKMTIVEEDERVDERTIDVDEYVLSYLEKACKRAGQDSITEIEQNYKRFLNQSKNVLKVLKKVTKAIYNKKEDKPKEELMKKYGLSPDGRKITFQNISREGSVGGKSPKLKKIQHFKTEISVSESNKEMSLFATSPIPRKKLTIPQLKTEELKTQESQNNSYIEETQSPRKYFIPKALTSRSFNKKNPDFSQISSHKYERKKSSPGKTFNKQIERVMRKKLPTTIYNENLKQNIDSRKAFSDLLKNLNRINDVNFKQEIEKLETNFSRSLQNSKNILNPVLESLFLTYDKREFNLNVFKAKPKGRKLLIVE